MAIYVRNKEGVMETYKIVGLKGENGVTPDIQIGTVTTLEPGQQATVTKEGTNERPIFNFGIPKGEKGEGGSGGSSGSGVLIDDSTISKNKTWSSAKIEDYVLTNVGTIWKDITGGQTAIDSTMDGFLREVEILGNTTQGFVDCVTNKQIVDAILLTGLEDKAKLNDDGTFTVNKPSFDSSTDWSTINKEGFIQLEPNTKYSVGCWRDNGAFPLCFYTLYEETGIKTSTGVAIHTFTTGKSGKVLLYPGSAQTGKLKIRVVKGDYKLTDYPYDFNLSDIKHLGVWNKEKQGYEIEITVSNSSNKDDPNYKSHKTTILIPCQLSKVGDISDRLYWDSSKGKYVVEKHIFSSEVKEYVLIDKPNARYYFNVNYDHPPKINTGMFLGTHGISNIKHGRGGIYYDGYWTLLNGQLQNYSDEYINGLLPSMLYYQVDTPQLIETNITEELKLPTYINNTYISITGGIQGSIKAKAPVDGGKVIATLQRENIELKATNDTQDELINTTMLATDEMYMMLEPLLAEVVNLNGRDSGGSPIMNMYVAMIQRGIKTIESVPVSIRDCVAEILNNKDGKQDIE